jgi:TP901 family phage tail tape measure protein
MKGYKVAVEDTLGVVDKLSAVDLMSATDVGGLAEGMSQVAASANLAGVSMDKLLGYLAVVGETTQEGMSSVGTSFNAIFSRMGNIKLSRLKDYQNNGEDLSNVETVLRGEGISLRDSVNDFRNFGDVLDEVSGRWNSFSEVSQRAIASAFAGTHHMNDFIILMENYSTALKYTDTSLQSSGEAMDKFSAYQDSLAGHTEKFRNAFMGLSNSVVDSDMLKAFIDLGTGALNLSESFAKLTNSTGIIGLVGSGVLSATGKSVDYLKIINNVTDSLRGMSTEGKASSEALGSFSKVKTVFSTLAKSINVAEIAAKALNFALNAAVIAGVSFAIEKLVGAVDSYIHRVDIAKAAASDAKSNFESVQSELENINKELEANRDRISELNGLPSLTYVEEGELDKLKAATKELERQKDIKDIELKRAAEDLYKTNRDAFNKEFGNDSFNINDVAMMSNGETPDITLAQNGLIGLAAALTKVKDAQDEARKSGDAEWLDNMVTAESEYRKRLEDNLSSLQGYRDNLSEVMNYRDLTADEKSFYDNLEQGIRLIYQFTDPSAWNQIEFDQIFNTESLDVTKEKLVELAQAGKLDEDTINQYPKLRDAISKTDLILGDGETAVKSFINQIVALGKDTKETAETVSASFSKGDMISSINFLSEGFESLDKIMDSMKGKNPFDYSLLDDKKFKENFSGLGESYTQFIEQVSSSPKDVKGAQSAFNDLVTTWIDSTGVLANLNEENASLTIAMLKNMGVANADEVVSTNLAAAQEHLAAQKAYTADMSDALTNATSSEITGLINEATQSDIARVAIAGLALEKANANGTALDTSGDIENVISLIGVIGTASTALNNYNKLKAGQIFDANTQKANRDKIFSGGFNAGQLGQSAEEAKQLSDYNKQVEQAKAAAQKEVDDAIKSAKGYKGKGTQANVDYSGGVKTNKPSSGSKEKTKKEFSEIFDWVQITIDRVNEKIEQLKDKISNTSGWKAKNAITGTALDEMSTKVSALESQLNTYQGKLDEAGGKLSATYIDKIKNGTLEVETVTDEVISKNIKEYQDWYGKINDVNKELDSTKKAMQELAKSRLDNIINDFESLTSLMNKYSSYRKNLLDLQKSLGQEISNTDYEQLMNQQEDIYNQLQSEYSSLQSELSKAVSAGTIKVGSEEWRKYNGELIDINSSMNDAVSSMNDFRKALMDLPFEQLQMVSNEFDRINNGIGTMIDVMGSSGTTENGMITAKGLAQIALYGKQYANAKQQAAEYSNAISALNEMYDNGSITQEEYNSKLSEYTNAQLSAVKATKEAEDAIIQFRKTAIQEQIDDYNKLIEAKKKSRDEDKSYEEYLAQIEEKQKNISTLQAKIDELSTKSDASDRSAIATRLQLENDLVNARKDLAKTQSDYAYDQTTKSLDAQAEEYQNAKDKELNDLETSTDAQQKVIEDYLGQVKDNYKTVYNTLSKYGSDYNIEMTGDLVSPWESANTAVDTFQSAVSDAIAQINIDIGNLDLSKLTEMVQTMNGFSGGGNGSTFEDITGTGSWQKTSKGYWYGSSNDDYASDGIYTIGGKQYSFNEDGYMKTGWNDDSGEWRYFEPDNGQMVKSTWRKDKDGKEYYLKSDGTMATDTAVKAKSGNGYYYVDGDGVWDGKTLSYDDIKKKNISVSYKNGTDSTVSGLKNVGEDDIEELIVTKNGAILSSKGQDTVFTGSRTDVLRDFSKDPTNYITDKLLRNQMDLNSIATTNNSKPPISLTFNIDGDNVSNNNLNDFKVWATRELPSIIQQNMGNY